jgi:hypothetical protein
MTMRIHTRIRLQMYEYLSGELDDRGRAAVDEHIQACDGCRTELNALRSALAALPRPDNQPADGLSPEFWQSFMAEVERTIAEQEKPAPSTWSRIFDEFNALPIFQPRVAIAMAAIFVLILGGVLTREILMRPAADRTDTTNVAAARLDTLPTVDVNTRMSGYLRRSKNLLVGLTNMKPAPSGKVDLSTERRMSRELAHEARFLKQQALDERSVQLLSDLEKIQIELANLEEAHHASEVELIRHGIRRENLLFKVRVTETLYDRASFVQASYGK